MYIDDINRKLKDKYGFDWLDNPVFRIVWSDSQTEIRIGEHEKWYGGIYLGITKGALRFKKYEFITERWVLERLFPNQEELTGIAGNTTYEPLFTFQDKRSEYLEPNLRAADMICWMAMNPQRNFESFSDRQKREFAVEVNYFEEYIKNESSFLHQQMKHGEAIVVPKTYEG